MWKSWAGGACRNPGMAWRSVDCVSNLGCNFLQPEVFRSRKPMQACGRDVEWGLARGVPFRLWVKEGP